MLMNVIVHFVSWLSGRERGREGGREGGRGESGRVLTQGLGYRVLDKRFRQFECMG